MQILKPEEYYQMVAFYIISCQAQEEVRRHEKGLAILIDDKSVLEKVSDMIYNPSSRGTKKEFDEILFGNGISIEWKPAQNKFSKEVAKENKHVVG